jgi:hypothetical protein
LGRGLAQFAESSEQIVPVPLPLLPINFGALAHLRKSLYQIEPAPLLCPSTHRIPPRQAGPFLTPKALHSISPGQSRRRRPGNAARHANLQAPTGRDPANHGQPRRMPCPHFPAARCLRRKSYTCPLCPLLTSGLLSAPPPPANGSEFPRHCLGNPPSSNWSVSV